VTDSKLLLDQVNGKINHLSQSLDMQETVEDHSITSQEIPWVDWLMMETRMNSWVK